MSAHSRQLVLTALAGAIAVPGFGLPGVTGGAVPMEDAVSPGLSFLAALLALLPLLSIGWLFRQLSAKPLTTGSAARIGYAWGLGFFLAGVSWIYVSLAQFSGLPPAAAAAATLVFCAYLAVYPALACGLFARWQTADGGVRTGLCFAALWALSEWLRGSLFTGFPWLALGYSQVPPSPLAGYAGVVGVYGISFLVVFVSALFATLIRRPTLRQGVLAAIVITIGALLTQMDWTSAAGKPVSVRLFQGNVPQAVKWEPGQLERSVGTYQALADSLTDSPADERTINILPETALPVLYELLPVEIVSHLIKHADTLLGVAVRTTDGGYANAAIALKQGQANPPVGIYAKQHLVPFGEYSPTGFGWFFQLLRIPMSDFTAGSRQQLPIALGGQQIAANICYEDLFGEELLPALRNATLLINLSNTAWFGDSLAQPQHLQIARLRAMETGRVMLRATNSGMTAMIQPNGVVAAQLPAFTTGVLQVQAQGYLGLTPYAKWGNTLILSIALGIVLPAWRRRPRPRTPR